MPGDIDAFYRDNQQHIDQLVASFTDYSPVSVDRSRVLAWLDQFPTDHWSLVLRLAQAIRYYGVGRVRELTRTLHGLLLQQLSDDGVKLRDVFFVGLGRSGESGQHVATFYRNANQLRARQQQFLALSELPSALNAKKDNAAVVFLDDFVGTGSQMTQHWENTLSQLVPEYLHLYLSIVAACDEGIAHIQAHTPLTTLYVHPLGPNCRLRDARNNTFTKQEKAIISNYCAKIGNMPMGYGRLGLTVSFAYATPNNSISLIRGSRRQRPWTGLLPGWVDLP